MGNARPSTYRYIFLFGVKTHADIIPEGHRVRVVVDGDLVLRQGHVVLLVFLEKIHFEIVLGT